MKRNMQILSDCYTKIVINGITVGIGLQQYRTLPSSIAEHLPIN